MVHQSEEAGEKQLIGALFDKGFLSFFCLHLSYFTLLHLYPFGRYPSSNITTAQRNGIFIYYITTTHSSTFMKLVAASLSLFVCFSSSLGDFVLKMLIKPSLHSRYEPHLCLAALVWSEVLHQQGYRL